tara:strand:+ start:2397 stop:3113 length:717 start_codon:yes stop_codon:yes gene_type:complete
MDTTEMTQKEKDIEYHEVFMRQLKFYLCEVGHDLEKSVFRAHQETWEEIAMMHQPTEEEIFNKPLSDKCLIADSDDEEDQEHTEWVEKRLSKEQHKNDKLSLEIERLQKQNISLQKFKDEEEEYKKPFNAPGYMTESNALAQFVDLCQEVPDIKENNVTVAPMEFEELFYHYKYWCKQSAHLSPDKNKTKRDLIRWQRDSKYNLEIGEKMSEKCKNGTQTKPRFNLHYDYDWESVILD